ncbi:MAG: tail fiber domain-containing protein [Bacteroidales bacterium]
MGVHEEQRRYNDKPVIERTDRLFGVGIDDNSYNFPIEDLIGFFNRELDFNGGAGGDILYRVVDYGSNVNSIVDLVNLGSPIVVAGRDMLFLTREEPGRGVETFIFTAGAGRYGFGETQISNSNLIQVFRQVVSSDIDHDQTTNFVQNEHIPPDAISLVIEGGVLVVKQVNGHTVESDVPANADFTNTQRPISDSPTLNDASTAASTVATNTLNTNIQNHIGTVTGNPHNVLATQITDFDVEVSNNVSVTANTAYRGIGHIPLSQKGVANGVCPLNANGIIDPQFFVEVVQSNWLETDNTITSFVQNKPTDLTNLSLHNTDQLPEGLTNLYYTDTRVSQSTDVQANTVLRTMLSGVSNNTTVEKDASGNFIGATKNTAYNLNFGTTAGTVAQGNDSRFHDAVTLSSPNRYLSLSGQEITASLIDLTSDVSGILPAASGGTGINNFDVNNIARTNVNNNFSVLQNITDGLAVGGTTVIDASRNFTGGSGTFSGQIISSSNLGIRYNRSGFHSWQTGIDSQGWYVFNSTQNEYAITAQEDGAVGLRYNGSEKLATTNTGIDVTGAVTATSFSGSGASLTSLNATNISSGTLADARLSSNVALTNTAERFTDTLQVDGRLFIGTSAGAFAYIEANTGELEIRSQNSGSFISTDFTQFDGTTIRTALTLTTSGNVEASGTVTATNFILSSDETLKDFKDESIVDVSSIDIRKFNYKNDETNRDRYGVSAQELQKVAPEMVYENEAGKLQVGYIDFLLAKIDNLENGIKKMEV